MRARVRALSARVPILAIRALCLGLLIAVSGSAGPIKSFVPAGVKIERVVARLQFGEGPAWHPSGFLLFEDIGSNRMMKLDRNDLVSVYREPSGRSNGVAFDAQLRLVAAEGNWKGTGGRRVSRTESDGTVVTVAGSWNGHHLGSPNDLTIDSRGCIYFTDRGPSRQTQAIYRIDTEGKIARVATNLNFPNGIAVTHDGRALYVALNLTPGNQLWAFDVSSTCEVSNGRKIFEMSSGRGIDGLTLDAEGRIWAAAGTNGKAGIYVLEPDAARTKARFVGIVPLPEDPTNCTFGGNDRDILYITTAESLLRVRTNVKGKPGLPGK